LEHTAEDGKKYKTKFYNLDAIISVRYRVNSKRATEFRIWATQRLKEYLVKSYVINQKRLNELQQTIVAQSDPSEKELMTKLVCNLITKQLIINIMSKRAYLSRYLLIIKKLKSNRVAVLRSCKAILAINCSICKCKIHKFG
jgi:hypothetical protein